MATNDPRARQALYMAKKAPKSSMGFGSGRAILFIACTIAAIGGAIWLFVSLL